MKIIIQKPYCTSTGHFLSYPRVSFVCILKCRWSSSNKPYMTEKVIFDPHMIPRGKMKIPKPYCTSTRHSQSYPSVSFVYSMKRRQSFSVNNLIPLDKMKIPKPYCSSARHVPLYPRILFGYDLRCRRSLNDKKFLWRTKWRTDRGNNNIPELSLESAGIIKIDHRSHSFQVIMSLRIFFTWRSK